jgi:hypothetical protein
MNWKRLLLLSAGAAAAYLFRKSLSKLPPQRRSLSMLVRLKLPFPALLVFRGFLPEAKAAGLHLRLKGGRYIATAYMSDRRTQSANVSDIPDSPEELSRYIELFCKELTMEVEVAEVDPEVLIALEAGQVTEKTEEFGREFCEVVISVYNGLIDYFRNIGREYWLEPITVSPYSWRSPQGRFNGWRAEWLDSGGKWRRLLVGRDEDFRSVSLAGERDYIDQDRWREVASFIEAGKRAPMTTVLIANSLRHLAQDNDRLSVVEAVTAVEAYINTYLPALLLRLPGAAGKLADQIRKEQELPDGSVVEERHIKKHLETKGLRGTVDEVFTVIMAEAGLSADDVRAVREAINERNLVLHSSKRRVGIVEAKRYVSAIDRVLTTFRKIALATE